MRVALVTNCTNRKSLPPEVRAADINRSTLAGFVKEWLSQIDESDDLRRASELYLGRGFQEARQAWQSAASMDTADLLIASAGLGIVSANDKIPSYSITVSARGTDSVTSALGLEDAAEWWDQLTAGRRSLAARCAHADLIIVALSKPYLHMMRHELAAIARSNPERLRILGRNAPPQELADLAPFWVTYDSRLNSKKSPYPGAESDFAQRALRHFVEHILPRSKHLGAHGHAQAVERALAKMPRPRRKARNRLNDQEIIAVMRKIGQSVGAAKMLRILRDEKHVACEQSRCSTLFKKAFGERAPKQPRGRDASGNGRAKAAR